MENFPYLHSIILRKFHCKYDMNIGQDIYIQLIIAIINNKKRFK